MTVPSIKFQCPKCGRVELHINDGPCSCMKCKGKGATRRDWIRGKVRTVTYPTHVRMVRV